jgi:hypothetical protein
VEIGYLINSTKECQFDVFSHKHKKKEKVSSHATRKKISSDNYLIKQDMCMYEYMSESLHADYYLGLDVNSIFVEHHQNRKKQMPCLFPPVTNVGIRRGQISRWVSFV